MGSRGLVSLVAGEGKGRRGLSRRKEEEVKATQMNVGFNTTVEKSVSREILQDAGGRRGKRGEY